MFNVAVLTPSSGKCEFGYAQSLANMVLYFCSHAIDDSHEQGINIMGQQSFSTSCNREMLIDMAMKGDYSHILFIDDDMSFDPEVLNDLAKRDCDIIACNYPRKKIPMSFITIGNDFQEIKTTKESSGLEEVRQVGFGMALIKRQVFESIPKPRFPVPYNSAIGEYGSEDYWFCEQARKNGYKIFVDHDTSKKIGHIGSYVFRGDYD